MVAPTSRLPRPGEALRGGRAPSRRALGDDGLRRGHAERLDAALDRADTTTTTMATSMKPYSAVSGPTSSAADEADAQRPAPVGEAAAGGGEQRERDAVGEEARG